MPLKLQLKRLDFGPLSDKNITLNYSTGDSSSTADGAGITIQDAVDSSTDATILWDATNDKFDFSHGATFGGNVTITGGSDIFLADNGKTHYGASNDLEVYHDGSNNYVVAKGTGDLILEQQTDDKDIRFKCDDGSGGVTEYLLIDGSANNIKVYKDMRFADNEKAEFGTVGDLQILHDGTNSYISNSTGNLFISNNTDDGDIIFRSDDGSGGLETYFYLDGSAGGSDPATVFPDNSYVHFGGGFDLNIGHNGSNSYITNNTGDLYIRNFADDKDIIFQSDDGSGGVETYLFLDGSGSRTI